MTLCVKRLVWTQFTLKQELKTFSIYSVEGKIKV